MEPIFIHSLHRCASTWLFKVFRRSAGGYWCYAEPEHQAVKKLLEANNLLSVGQETADQLRHQSLERPYFWEIDQIKDKLRGYVSEEISYKNYFSGPNLDLIDLQYFEKLIEHSRGRPVLQLCRSAGRSHALKAAFGGIHIHLWREPIAQWWSMKVDPYFDDAVCLIYGLKSLPSVLGIVKGDLQIPDLDYSNPVGAIERVRAIDLSPVQRYRLFFGLWIYAQVFLSRTADVEFSVDRASLDVEYQHEVLSALKHLGVSGMSFYDCAAPGVQLHPLEVTWYTDIEESVMDNWMKHGFVPEIYEIRQKIEHIRMIQQQSCNPVIEAKRQRELILNLESRFHYMYQQWYQLTQQCLSPVHSYN